MRRAASLARVGVPADFLAWSSRTALWLAAGAAYGTGRAWARRLDQEATGRWHPISIRVVLRLPGDRAVPIRGGKVRPHDHPYSAPVEPPAPVNYWLELPSLDESPGHGQTPRLPVPRAPSQARRREGENAMTMETKKTVDQARLTQFIEERWTKEIVPTLVDY